MTAKFLGRTNLGKKTADLTAIELPDLTKYFVDVSDDPETKTFTTERAAREYIDQLARVANDIRIVESEVKCEIHNFADYGDGFSFTVATELDAYKSAYKYRFCRAVVSFAPNCGEWLVQIYAK